ncbi:DUF3426 domain-containing protein [Litoribacillus peritrichatus]|uniref:DUF3426 domain-containing protein n=1 Tax=Litoribacillus peritrichatus TaxID=718191 RepID=A0ABP7MX29_9GAMM
MVAELITQCPKCQTSFKVRNEQLKVAEGLVRCGSCLHVFNAVEYSALNNDAPTPPPANEDKLEMDDMFGPQDTISKIDQDFDLSDDSVNEMFSPEQKPKSKNTAPKQDIEPEETFLTITDDLDGEDIDADELFGKSEESDNQQDDSWAEELLRELDSSVEEDENTPQETVPKSDSAPNNAFQFSEEEEDDFSRSQINGPQIESEPVYLSTEKTTADKKQIYSTVALSVGCLFAISGLILQLAWLNFNQWSKLPSLRPAYSVTCQIIDCKLPHVRAIEKIRASNLIVRSDNKNNKHLLIDAVILNQASFTQPFPKLALIFSDNDGQDIASGLILPKQYLGGELSGVTNMPTNTPIHIAFKILDPGANARSYRIEFYP